MMQLTSRQLLIAAALLAALIVAVMARRSEAPASRAAQPSNSSRGSAAAGPKTASVDNVKLDLLKPSPGALEPITRNPFQFRPKPAPPVVARPAVVAGRGAPVLVAPLGPPGPPPLPPIGLKYIGVLDTSQGKVAVFRDNGGDVINGKEGDIIDGRYKLLKIGVESADLSYADGRGRQTIRLSGQ